MSMMLSGDTVPAGRTAAASAFLTDLLGCWRMNELGAGEDSTSPATSTWADATANARDMTLSGNTVYGLSGKNGNATSANNKYIYRADAGAIFAPAELSTNFWVKVNTAASGSGGAFLLTKYQTSPQFSWGILHRNTGDANASKLQLFISADGSASSLNTYSAHTLTADGNWHMVTFVHSAADDYARVWLDGTLTVNSSYSSGIHAGTQELRYGYQGAANYFLDELAIWGRALSTDEIASLWASGAGLFYPF